MSQMSSQSLVHAFVCAIIRVLLDAPRSVDEGNLSQFTKHPTLPTHTYTQAVSAPRTAPRPHH